MSTYVNLPVSLDTIEAAAALEPYIRQAWYEGYATRNAVTTGADGIGQAEKYADWRAFGPGANIPGGQAYRARIEMRDHHLQRLRTILSESRRGGSEDDVVVCIRHLSFDPCRHGSENDPCHSTRDEHAANIVRRYQDS